MSDTCDRCHRPLAATTREWVHAGRSNARTLCAAHLPVAGGKDEDCADARNRWLVGEVARLTAELAAARKPRWEGSDLYDGRVPDLIGWVCSAQGGGWMWVAFATGTREMQRGVCITEAEAKAAAELACGGEVSP